MLRNEFKIRELERIDLFRELERQKMPSYGFFNSNYLEEMSVNKPLINQKFEALFEPDTYENMVQRKSISNLIRK